MHADGPLPELAELESVIALGGARLECVVPCQVRHFEQQLPMYAIALGSRDPRAPVVAYVGGVHGLERIGSRVVIAFLHNIVSRLAWDAMLVQLLDRVRLVFLPIVNPGGMVRHTRANPQGVDLMRNSPVECRDAAPFL